MRKTHLFSKSDFLLVFIATLILPQPISADTRPGGNPMWHYCTIKVANQSDSRVSVSYRWKETDKWRLFRDSIVSGETYTKEMPIGNGFQIKATLFMRAENSEGRIWTLSSEVKKDVTYTFVIKK